MNPISDHTMLNYEPTKEGDKIRKALSKRIEAHNKDLADVEAKAAELQAIDPAAWTSKHDEQTAQVRARRRDAVVREIAIREELTAWFSRVESVERQEASNVAFAEWERRKVEAKEKLLGIGYREAFDNDPAFANLVGCHPDVRAAKNNADSIQSSNVHDLIKINDAALRQCHELLAEYRREATAGLAA